MTFSSTDLTSVVIVSSEISVVSTLPFLVAIVSSSICNNVPDASYCAVPCDKVVSESVALSVTFNVVVPVLKYLSSVSGIENIATIFPTLFDFIPVPIAGVPALRTS